MSPFALLLTRLFEVLGGRKRCARVLSVSEQSLSNWANDKNAPKPEHFLTMLLLAREQGDTAGLYGTVELENEAIDQISPVLSKIGYPSLSAYLAEAVVRRVNDRLIDHLNSTSIRAQIEVLERLEGHLGGLATNPREPGPSAANRILRESSRQWLITKYDVSGDMIDGLSAQIWDAVPEIGILHVHLVAELWRSKPGPARLLEETAMLCGCDAPALRVSLGRASQREEDLGPETTPEQKIRRIEPKKATLSYTKSRLTQRNSA